MQRSAEITLISKNKKPLSTRFIWVCRGFLLYLFSEQFFILFRLYQDMTLPLVVVDDVFVQVTFGHKAADIVQIALDGSFRHVELGCFIPFYDNFAL